MAEMSFGKPRHSMVKREQAAAPSFNPMALLQGCASTRIDENPPLVVDFPERPAKMLAAVLPDYGPPSRLKVQLCDLPRLPLGKLKPSEMIIRVECAAVNPTDWKQRKGTLAQIAPLTLPTILGIDLSGTVMRAGEDAPFSEGDEVMGRQTLDRMRELNGTYSEYCIVESSDVYRKPANLSHQEAAAVPHAALAAYAALGHVGKMVEKRKQPDKAVLILGGSGGVGTFAVQLAKHHFDCYVMASCSERNMDLVRELGADEALDYMDPGFTKSVGYTKFDVILDCVGGDDYWAAFSPHLQKDGVYVTLVGNERYLATDNSMDYGSVLQIKADYFFRKISNSLGAAHNYHILTGSQIQSSDLRIIASLLEKGTIRPVIDQTFSLYDVAKAHERSETFRAVGKIIVQVRNPGKGADNVAQKQPEPKQSMEHQMAGLLNQTKQRGRNAEQPAQPAPIIRSRTPSEGRKGVKFNDSMDEEDEEWDDTAPAQQPPGMQYGAPGLTTTAGSIPFGGFAATPAGPPAMRDLPGRPGSGAPKMPGPGTDDLTSRLEQLQKEVSESAQKVASLKLKPSVMEELNNMRAGQGLAQKPPAPVNNESASMGPFGALGAQPDDEDLSQQFEGFDMLKPSRKRNGKQVPAPQPEPEPDDDFEEDVGPMSAARLGWTPGVSHNNLEAELPFIPKDKIPSMSSHLSSENGAPSRRGQGSAPQNDENLDPEKARRAAALAKLKEMVASGNNDIGEIDTQMKPFIAPKQSQGPGPGPQSGESLRELRRKMAESSKAETPDPEAASAEPRVPVSEDEDPISWFREAKKNARHDGVKPYPVKTVQPPKPEIDVDEEGEEPVTPAPQPKKQVRMQPEPQLEEPAPSTKATNGADTQGGPIQFEGLLKRKKEDHGRFEDPYKMLCVCRLQDSILRVRITHNNEVVGVEEQFDLREWRVVLRNDKRDRFSLARVRPQPGQPSQATFKADSKDEGIEWLESLQQAAAAVSGRGGATQSKQDALAARMRAMEDQEAPAAAPSRGAAAPTGGSGAPTKAGVGIVFKDTLRDGDNVLVVKSLANGGPAQSSGRIEIGDMLVSVDGQRVNTTEGATAAILGDKGSTITMVFEREDGLGGYDRYTVAMLRGKAATLR